MRANELTVYRDDSTIMWTRRILVLFAVLVLFASTVFGVGQSAQATPVAELTAGEQTIPGALTADASVENSMPTASAGSDTGGPSSLAPGEGPASDTSHEDETEEAPSAESSPADQEADPTTPADVPTKPSVDESLEADQAATTEDDQSAIVDDPAAPEMSQRLASPETTSVQTLNIGPQAENLAAPEALFKEDFENGSAAVPLALGSYQGVSGMKYSASDYWRDAKYCNGFITTAESNPSRNDVATKYCGLNGDSTDNNLGDYNAVRTKAQALGTFANQMDGTSGSVTRNRALSTNTSGGAPDSTMFRTATSNITLKNNADKRFFAFSVDAAVTYEAGSVPNKPEMYFSLVKNGQSPEKLYDTGASIPGTGGVQFDLYQTSPVNSNQRWASQGIVGRFFSNSFLMEGNQQIGLLLENFSRASSVGCGAYSGTTANPNGCTNTGNAWRQGTDNGNDGAIDNIRISDVSPTTEKAFSPGRVPVGQTSTMTITVKNRTDLQKKDGWKFVDSLPAGLEFANANVGGTCVANGSQIAVDRTAKTLTVTRGILDHGQESCTITTTVTSQQAKLFTNGGPNGNFPSRELVGIDAPNNANVEFYEPSALQCSANSFYSVRADGELRRGTVGSNQTTLVGTWKDSVSGTPSVNGLGIASGGTHAYAYHRYTSGTANYVQVLKYTTATGVFETAGQRYQINTTAAGNASANNMIAGAVDPTTGDYYFGGYGSSNPSRFRLYRFNITTNAVSYVGYIQPKDQTTTGNGDIGFDNEGNLFLIFSQSTTNQIVPVAASDLAAASSASTKGLIPSSDTQPKVTNTSGLQFNGISFLSDGSVVVQASNQSGAATKVWSADPNNWQLSNEQTIFPANSSNGTDLATCMYPSTITVKKNVIDRVNTSDQFTMEVTRDDIPTTTLGRATTAGSALGFQPQVTGPVLAKAGQKYTIKETGASGTNLSRYQTTWTCDVEGGMQGWPKSGTGTTISIDPFPEPLTSFSSGPAITCTFTNAPPPPGPELCTADSPFIYNQLSQGTAGSDYINKLQRYNVTTGQVTDYANLSSTVKRETNGLGISGEGRYFYLIDFNINIDDPKIYRYDSTTSEVAAFPAANRATANDNNRVRRGGVDLKTGVYYYSTTQMTAVGGSTASNVHNLYALNLAGQSWYVGTVTTKDSGQSGDLSFDRDGNMYFVVGNNSTAYVNMYTGHDLPTTPNSVPIAVSTEDLNQVGATGNGVGIAYGKDGYLFASNTAGNIFQLDPSTGALVNQLTGVGGSGATVDLATCASPNTLTLMKDYPKGRANQADNVSLNAWRNLATQIGKTVTTDGPAAGVQAKKIGPLPILVGSENAYLIRETASGGTFEGYGTEYQCVDANDSTWSMNGTLTESTIQRQAELGHIPSGGANPRAIECTFSNTPLGSAAWQKIDASASPTVLAGSEWKLVGPDSESADIEITDCVGANDSACAGQADKDSRSGYFKVTKLQLGEYRLIETKAPAGYKLDPQPRPFTISSEALNYIFAEGIVNHPRETPNLPLTGGLGRDHFFIVGAVVVIAGGSAALVTQIRRRRKEAA